MSLKTRNAKLTEAEKIILNELTIGYGKLVTASLTSGIDAQVIRYVRRNGYGHPETIKTMRKKLFPQYKVTV